MKRWVILIPVFSLFFMVIVPVFSYAQSRHSYGPKAGYSGYHHRAPSSYTGSSHRSYRDYKPLRAWLSAPAVPPLGFALPISAPLLRLPLLLRLPVPLLQQLPESLLLRSSL